MSLGDSTLAESQLESSLEPQELQLADLLINQATNAVFCLDSNAKFVYVNNAICMVTEYSRQELLSMYLYDVEVDLSPINWLDRWRLLKQNNSLTYKSSHRTKTGKMLAVENTITYVETKGKELICAFARQSVKKMHCLNAKKDVQQQVSKLKQKEEELGTSLSLLHSTLESTANAILAVSFEGEMLYFNQKFVDMWQLPESLILNRKCPRCKAHFESQIKDPATFRRVVWEVSNKSDFESYEMVELKDGRVFAHYSQPHIFGEKVIGRVWSIWDVTETKRTEEALRLSEARFRTLAETTNACIFLIQATQICYVNPAAEVVTGYKTKEILSGFNLRKLIKSRKRRRLYKQDGAGIYEYQEMQILTKNGTERWLACSVGVLDGVYDFGGKRVELITAIDITDYKQVETDVRQALEQAKQLSELRSRFVSMVCHQLRTPLNIVSFSTSLLKRHTDQWTTENKRPLLDQIQTAVEQISKQLDDVLLFGKAEAAKLKLEPKPLDLVTFCEDLIAQIQMSHSQDIINFVHDNNWTTVNLDEKLLQPILTNLLENAIKYSPNGNRVDFELTCQSENIIFQVKDQGIGIPRKDQDQLFEPFYRGSNVDSIPGTGLGLSIAKTLVDLHDGEIAVESEVGVGTTFTIVLPLIK